MTRLTPERKEEILEYSYRNSEDKFARELLSEITALESENKYLKEGEYSEIEEGSAEWEDLAIKSQKERDELKDEVKRLLERIEKLEKIKRLAKEIANTWWEFGPEVGFGEIVDALEEAFNDDEKESSS